MTKRALSEVARRIRPAVFAELQARIDQLARRGEALIPLHIGDTHLAPPEGARRVLDELDPNDASLHRYGATAGLSQLREAIARVLERTGSGGRHITNLKPNEEILIGNGGTHALYCAARAILDEGDEVILASPYWPLAPGVFTSSGAVPVEAPLTQKLFEDPSLDPHALLGEALTARTKAIYFISPNNPDGKVLTKAQIERVAAFALEHDLWVFADEVYADVVFADAPEGGSAHEGSPRSFPPSIATLDGMRERTIVLGSLSKSHALAGLRVGFVAAPERVVTAGRRVSTHTAFNVSVAMQRAAVSALEDDAFPVMACDVYRSARDAAARALEGAPVRFHVAEGATYLFLDFAPAIRMRARRGGQREELIAILEHAIDRGVLLAPGDAFGAAYTTFARLCYTAVPEARVVDGIARLREGLDAYLHG